MSDEWYSPVNQIYKDIQDLSFKDRRELWDKLKRAFPRVLDDTDPTPLEVWDDPQSGFGKMETGLLRFLGEHGEMKEREVLKHLWPDEWGPHFVLEANLRERLRKLEQRVRTTLLALKSDWILRRPCPGWLELTR